jgi:ribosomal protein L37AE/L43A
VTCPVCAKREARYPQVCDVCRARLASQLWELSDLYSIASAALIPGSRAGQRVSGSRERGLPLSAGVMDLLTPVIRLGGWPVDSTRDIVGDQTGRVPVAVVLDSWVRDWIDVRAMREARPQPVVADMRQWLVNRLGWACDHHPAVDEFADEITCELFALRAVLNVSRRKIRLKEPCPSCGMVLSLVRDPGGGKIVECQNCGEAWDDPVWLASVLADEAA